MIAAIHAAGRHGRRLITHGMFVIAATVTLAPPVAAAQPAPIVIGLDADMSSGAARSGEAIRRGIVLAMDEINAQGGVLGRPLELLVRDHRGNPARGIDNILEFAQIENLAAVVGGLHTPVAMAELEAIHQHRIVYLGPWAAGTPIVANGFEPNYVFRVSVRDEFAGRFLIDAALERGFQRPGLLLWRTAWGRSNERAMNDALAQLGRGPAAIAWFNTGHQDFSDEIEALVRGGADIVMLVANPVDGLAAVQAIAARAEGDRIPVISHWGITGGDFHNKDPEAVAGVDLTFLQTFSFAAPPFPRRAERVHRAYCAAFKDCTAPENAISPVGTAHAYDLVHLLKLAIEKAGTTERTAVRAALENLGRFEGLMRDYDPAFTPDRHDALDASSFRLARYTEEGGIAPLAR